MQCGLRFFLLLLHILCFMKNDHVRNMKMRFSNCSNRVKPVVFVFIATHTMKAHAQCTSLYLAINVFVHHTTPVLLLLLFCVRYSHWCIFLPFALDGRFNTKPQWKKNMTTHIRLKMILNLKWKKEEKKREKNAIQSIEWPTFCINCNTVSAHPYILYSSYE